MGETGGCGALKHRVNLSCTNTMADLSEIATEDLMKEVERRLNCQSKPEKRLILVGPPGSGKGTQAPAIRKDHCLCHLATGDMLRAAVAAKTSLGMEAKAAMESGALVSDDLVVGIIGDAIKKPECRTGSSTRCSRPGALLSTRFSASRFPTSSWSTACAVAGFTPAAVALITRSSRPPRPLALTT